MQSPKKYFQNHPSIDELHFTSDGLAFINPSDASSHSNNLEDKAVKKMTRDEAMNSKEETVIDEKGEALKLAEKAVANAEKEVAKLQKVVNGKQQAFDGKTIAADKAKDAKKEAALHAAEAAKQELADATTALNNAVIVLGNAKNDRAAFDEPVA